MTYSFKTQKNIAEVILFAFGPLVDAYEVFGVALRQVLALLEHLALGGDPDAKRVAYLKKKDQQ